MCVLLLNIYCGYSLEPPQRIASEAAVLTCIHYIICFEQKYENSHTKNQLKIVFFTAVKNRCISHGHVFVMFASVNSSLMIRSDR